MKKAYKFRIYPNKEQEGKIIQNINSSNWIYNYTLYKKQEAYKKNKKNLSVYDIQSDIPKLKKQEETKWLSKGDSMALIFSLRNLDSAFKKFFKEHKGFPRFKKKGDKESYTTYQGIEIDWNKKKLILPKDKSGIKIVLHRFFKARITSGTISRTKTGKYYISLITEDLKNEPKKKPIKERTAIGIDLGLKHFIILSNGEKIVNPRYLRHLEKRYKMLSRRLSKKKKGSKNWNKARIKLAKLAERIANLRKDLSHKTSNRIVNEFDTICIEDLQVKNMVKNHKLAKSINDVSWSEFTRQLEYKCNERGKNLIRIGKFEPSSKTCSKCGCINKELKLSDRNWICKECGTEHDRDVNAAINIKNIALYNLKTMVAKTKS